MRLAIVSPEKFAEWFNVVVPGAYRKINNQDIRDMCDVGLIHKYQYFGRSDLEIVRVSSFMSSLGMNEAERKIQLGHASGVGSRCLLKLMAGRGDQTNTVLIVSLFVVGNDIGNGELDRQAFYVFD